MCAHGVVRVTRRAREPQRVPGLTANMSPHTTAPSPAGCLPNEAPPSVPPSLPSPSANRVVSAQC